VSDCRLKEGEIVFVVDECLENTVEGGTTIIAHNLVRTDIPVVSTVLSLGLGALVLVW
jgi:hypothetical protein